MKTIKERSLEYKIARLKEIYDGIDSVSLERYIRKNNIPDKVVQTAALHNDDKDNLERDNKIAQLEKDNKEMKEAQIKQDLSLKYAQLFPEPMRQAQIKSFMSHKEGPRILEARLDEATVLLSKQTTSHYKQAQIESTFTFDDTNVESDNTVDLGSVI